MKVIINGNEYTINLENNNNTAKKFNDMFPLELYIRSY